MHTQFILYFYWHVALIILGGFNSIPLSNQVQNTLHITINHKVARSQFGLGVEQ